MNSIILSADRAEKVNSGEITAFYVPVKPQPKPSDVGKIGGTDRYAVFKPNDVEPAKTPYSVGQKIYVREPRRTYLDTDDNYNTITEFKSDGNYDPFLYECDGDGFQVFNKDGGERCIPWKLCSKSAARTWLEITGIECVKAREANVRHIIHLYGKDHNCGDNWEPDFIKKHGLHAWDSNIYIFLFTFKPTFQTI